MFYHNMEKSEDVSYCKFCDDMTMQIDYWNNFAIFSECQDCRCVCYQA